MRSVFVVFCLLLICVSVIANINVEVNVNEGAASHHNHGHHDQHKKLHSMIPQQPKQQPEDDDEVIAVHAGNDANPKCTAAGGSCGTTCNDGTFLTGKCNGGTEVKCCVKNQAPTGTGLDRIMSIASSSSCRSYQWKNRGRMPAGYAKGFALTWAKSICNADRADVAFVSQAKTSSTKDSLNFYDSNFRSLGLSNSVAGLDTARHTYTLLMGLGMRESSGSHCVGRDMSANFNTASSAEAGLFQTSFGASRSSPILPSMYQKYKANTKACFLNQFKEGVSCSASNWKNWGTGDGMTWQQLTKDCPAFALEYASVVLRSNGGAAGEFGPIRRKDVELRPECDSMLKQVQDYVKATPDVCARLNQ
jgi:uncharacterized protein YfiM (DUF2279 family)